MFVSVSQKCDTNPKAVNCGCSLPKVNPHVLEKPLIAFLKISILSLLCTCISSEEYGQQDLKDF